MKIDRLIHSKRKTLALVVRNDGSLEARAPLRMNHADIQRFVDAKADWITRQRAKAALSPAPEKRIGYANGARLWLLGRPITLIFTRNSRQIQLDGSRLLVPVELQPTIDSAMAEWYRDAARQLIGERAAFYAGKTGLHYESIRINAARTRWGSCSRANRLNFPYRLVMAPLDIVDYVVVHELVHTVERNHGRGYWAKVEAILPSYRLQRMWLKLNGHLLDLSFDADPQTIQSVSASRR